MKDWLHNLILDLLQTACAIVIISYILISLAILSYGSGHPEFYEKNTEVTDSNSSTIDPIWAIKR